MTSEQSPDIYEPDSPQDRHTRQALRVPSRRLFSLDCSLDCFVASERFLAVRGGRRLDDRIRLIPSNPGTFLQIVGCRRMPEEDAGGGAGGGTRTPDTRIMIPLL
jgi:hypothetical protein